jgi:hypothetical protein
MKKATLVVITRQGCPPCARLESNWNSLLQAIKKEKLPVAIRKISLSSSNPQIHSQYPAPISTCNWTPAVFLIEQGEWEQAVEKKKKSSKKNRSVFRNFQAFGFSYPQGDPLGKAQQIPNFPYSLQNPQSFVAWLQEGLTKIEKYQGPVYSVDTRETGKKKSAGSEKPKKPLQFKKDSSSSPLFCTSNKCYRTVPKK